MSKPPENSPADPNPHRNGSNGQHTAGNGAGHNGDKASVPGMDVVTDSSHLPAVLSAEEARELKKCETIIRSGWGTFVAVGRALAKIRDQRLYRGSHKTFEEYCRETHEFSKSHANRLISAAAVVDMLAPIGVKIQNEAQARPLTGLQPDKIQAAGKKVLEFAGQGRITARHIQEAAREFLNGHGQSNGTPKKVKVRQTVNLKPALRLVATAEKAAQAQDMNAVLQALAELRECLRGA